MKTKKLSLIWSLLFLMTACGNSSKESGDTGTVEYFAPFMTSKGGVLLSDEMPVTNGSSCNGNFNSFSSGSLNNIFLRLDTDGTYFIYSKGDLSEDLDDGRQLKGVYGTWEIKDKHMELEGLGATPDYIVTQSSVNQFQPTNLSEMSERCFTINATNTLDLPQNGSTNFSSFNSFGSTFGGTSQISSGSCFKVCKAN